MAKKVKKKYNHEETVVIYIEPTKKLDLFLSSAFIGHQTTNYSDSDSIYKKYKKK